MKVVINTMKGNGAMKCYDLAQDANFNSDTTPRSEISAELESSVISICQSWQARNLCQKGYSEDFDSDTVYEPLTEENFVISGGEVVGYYADHFNCSLYISIPIEGEKVSLGSYDFSDYHNTWRVDRGFVAIVPRPDTDTNPYYDEPRFHSQEEYNDYIKWRD